MTIDLAALFAELAESRPTGDGAAMTTSDIIAKTGRTDRSVQKLIRKAQELGLCESTRIQRRGIDGVMRHVQAYVFKAQGVAE